MSTFKSSRVVHPDSNKAVSLTRCSRALVISMSTDKEYLHISDLLRSLVREPLA